MMISGRIRMIQWVSIHFFFLLSVKVNVSPPKCDKAPHPHRWTKRHQWTTKSKTRSFHHFPSFSSPILPRKVKKSNPNSHGSPSPMASHGFPWLPMAQLPGRRHPPRRRVRWWAKPRRSRPRAAPWWRSPQTPARIPRMGPSMVPPIALVNGKKIEAENDVLKPSWKAMVWCFTTYSKKLSILLEAASRLIQIHWTYLLSPNTSPNAPPLRTEAEAASTKRKATDSTSKASGGGFHRGDPSKWLADVMGN